MPSTLQISTKAGIRAPKVQLLQSSPLSHLQGVSLHNPAVISLEVFQVLNHSRVELREGRKLSEISSTRKDVVAKGEKQEKGRRRRGQGE